MIPLHGDFGWQSRGRARSVDALAQRRVAKSGRHRRRGRVVVGFGWGVFITLTDSNRKRHHQSIILVRLGAASQRVVVANIAGSDGLNTHHRPCASAIVSASAAVRCSSQSKQRIVTGRQQELAEAVRINVVGSILFQQSASVAGSAANPQNTSANAVTFYPVGIGFYASRSARLDFGTQEPSAGGERKPSNTAPTVSKLMKSGRITFTRAD